jgi:hypothetical protein
MKRTLIALMLVLSFLALFPASPVAAQGTDRPVVTISTYTPNKTPARGEDFNLSVIFHNSGHLTAYNLFIEFVSGDLVPRGNGGTQSIYQLSGGKAVAGGESKGIKQGFTVSPDLWGASIASVTVNLEYSDDQGNSYSDSFTLSINLQGTAYVSPSATPTPTAIVQPQLVITSYETDVPILQPGTTFELDLEVTNLGNGPAKAMSMVLGGGGVEMNPEGTPQPGISGGEGAFADFAPLEASNIVYLGDLAPGESLSASQKIIVNVSTAPGAYSLKYSFIYSTEAGDKVVDNQVITLLIYQLPVLEVGFYQDPGPLFMQQPNNLPLQVMNLGKNNVVLGNMEVTADGAVVENGVALVGPVEAGFYFTLDSMIIPEQAGPMELHIRINYTDDFNQPQVFETTVPVEVIEVEMPPEGMPGPDGGMQEGFEGPIEEGMPGLDSSMNGAGVGMPGQETLWQKIVRAVKGFFGLDSGQNSVDPMQMPGGGGGGGGEMIPMPEEPIYHPGDTG